MSDAYSQMKPLYWFDRIEQLRSAIEPAPVHVQLILSDLCNQDCHFCAYRMSGGLSTELFATPETHNPNRKIPTDKAIEIIKECSELGVEAIQFTGGGEPTVHAHHLSIIRYAQSLGLKTALVTNGVKLNTGHVAIQNLDWIRISIDAGTPATYAEIRGVLPVHWDKVWKNIRELENFKGRLGVGFVVTDSNYKELPMLAERCRAFGVPSLRVGAVFSEHGLDFYDDIHEIHAVIEATKEQYDSDDLEIIDLFGRRLSDLESSSPEFEFCGYQYFTTYIGADLNVYRCCNTAYTKHGLIGNLEKQTLDGLQRAPFDARTCKYCQFLGQNRAINSLMTMPDNVEFV